ncbi:MAG TPA: CsbD family protein, partial [Gemmatirosa sp.]
MADERTYDQGVDDSLTGKGSDLKGKLKDAAGGLTGDSQLQGEGKLDQLKGKVQDAIGKVERKLSE